MKKANYFQDSKGRFVVLDVKAENPDGTLDLGREGITLVSRCKIGSGVGECQVVGTEGKEDKSDPAPRDGRVPAGDGGGEDPALRDRVRSSLEKPGGKAKAK